MQLNYKEYGSGQPLIILHGFLGSLDNWHTLSTAWGNNGVHVYTLDMRNHGRSPHTPHHTIQLMVDDLRGFMQQQNITKASILGHSMGGKVAMQFALRYPKYTDKLIVADMAPRKYGHAHDDVFRAIFGVPLTQVRTRKEVEEQMQTYLPDAGTRQFIMKSLDRTGEGTYAWKFNAPVLRNDYEKMLEQTLSDHPFAGPTLFLKGERSDYITAKDEPSIKQLFPAAQIHTIARAGHWLHAEQADQFSKEVLNFLTS